MNDINWGALDHASRAPQLNYYYVCVCVCVYVHTWTAYGLYVHPKCAYSHYNIILL